MGVQDIPCTDQSSFLVELVDRLILIEKELELLPSESSSRNQTALKNNNKKVFKLIWPDKISPDFFYGTLCKEDEQIRRSAELALKSTQTAVDQRILKIQRIADWMTILALISDSACLEVWIVPPKCCLDYRSLASVLLSQYLGILFFYLEKVSNADQDLNKNSGRSTDCNKKQHRSADLYHPIHPSLLCH